MTSLPSTSGLVRITVMSSRRRADLVVPSMVPVAELVPELARCVGALDALTAYRGYRVVTRGGRELRSGLGLSAQGVADGDVIAISAGDGDEPPRHDDVAEAVAQVVHGWRPWTEQAGCRARRCAGLTLLLLAAPALLAEHSRATAAFCSTLVVALGTAAFLLSRVRGQTISAVTSSWLGGLYAAVAGVGWSGPGPVTGRAVMDAGAGVLASGLISVATMRDRWPLMLPALAVGAVGLTTGAVTAATTVDPAALLTGLLALVVVVSGVLPGLALTATGAGRHALSLADGSSAAEGAGIDVRRLAAHVGLAREILVAGSAAAGLLIVALAPAAVSLEPCGVMVPILGCAVVMLRSRRYRAAADVLVARTSGFLGIVSTLVSMWWLDDGRRLVVAIVLAVGGAAVLSGSVLCRGDVVRRGRLGDLVERVALGSLFPVALIAVGFSFGRS